MPRTQFTNMHLLLIVIMSGMYFSEMAAAQPACDPLTQYERKGECCKMCAPGTSMSSLSTCLDPQCTECGDNEYRDKYTTEPKCQLQPYCDPHKNFDDVGQMSKRKRSACECKVGFHCSSVECITCVPHALCELGHGARSKGNHTHNTVCQKCTGGTFSEDKSWDGVCAKWKECLKGHHVEQSGTDVSDNICEETSRSHTVVIVVCSVVLFLFGVICAGWCCLCKGKPGDANGNLKVCVESCLGDKKEPQRETNVLITNPTDAIEEESLVPDLQCSHEEAGVRTPEENEDELSQVLSEDFVLTENGNFVTQEDGKSIVLSRQESQTQTFTD
ncbi:tumor necrosis factor receptor superfamily member 5 isoform X1 [Cyclopterus lumpus]|uniref:tumor necrosis factor receptor superfamily member 5 isoform X1 n=1 Tax=Cyclopterus lumpus TaxID=8103 RepID=UPI00148610BE|nr:tumor necrosis factor receptor superfamily member 5 isoform X1 [Cyclopterus lumpus]